jgi:hypothetical protein
MESEVRVLATVLLDAFVPKLKQFVTEMLKATCGEGNYVQ